MGPHNVAYRISWHLQTAVSVGGASTGDIQHTDRHSDELFAAADGEAEAT